MTDLEKVIDDLQDAVNDDWMWQHADFYARTMEKAIQWLKEQEPVEPIPPTDESDLWKCGNCNHQLFRCTHQRYCEMCGREVKWE